MMVVRGKSRRTADKISFMIDLIQDEMHIKDLLATEHHAKKRIAYKNLIFLLKQERKSLK